MRQIAGCPQVIGLLLPVVEVGVVQADEVALALRVRSLDRLGGEMVHLGRRADSLRDVAARPKVEWRRLRHDIGELERAGLNPALNGVVEPEDARRRLGVLFGGRDGRVDGGGRGGGHTS